jgi:hypothetical protein
VNWETGYMMIQIGNGSNVIFQCLSADCKVVHEFIGDSKILRVLMISSAPQLVSY